MAAKPYTQHGSQIWRHNRLVAMIPHDGSMLDVARAAQEADEITRQLNAVAELAAALKECAKWLRYGGFSLDEREAAVKMADEALAKAGIEP